jgi:hypothetical protein
MEHGYPQEGQVNVITEVPRGRNFGRKTEKGSDKKGKPQLEPKGFINFSPYGDNSWGAILLVYGCSMSH